MNELLPVGHTDAKSTTFVPQRAERCIATKRRNKVQQRADSRVSVNELSFAAAT
jgi:hypothetical protein